ncbi:MAG TPA: CapA family protein [Bryobacteraceae bacterium]|nr:CapA family protein [Bryobacteraceae bacterium]
MPTSQPGDRGWTLFLAGDVMTGRGIDQILPHASDPQLHESYVDSALEYVALAERAHGGIPRPVGFGYPWGDALQEFQRFAPDARIVNLETSITARAEYEPKGINYRMHPANTPCLAAAGIDCCTLANNHVLDWGRAGLLETLSSLRAAGIRTAGAGRDAAEALQPAAFPLSGGRLLVFAAATADCGAPPHWVAAANQPGIVLLPDATAAAAEALAAHVRTLRRPGDAVVVSIHWGGNWGYEIPPAHREFAHRLIDCGEADVIHGHSSHHAKAIEVYRERLILYGCGDFLNDYEGISGYEEYRSNLAVMYFVTLRAGTGELRGLTLVPLETRRFRLQHAARADAEWVRRRLDSEAARWGARVLCAGEGSFELRWR